MQAVKKAFRTTVDKMNNANNNNCVENHGNEADTS